jgi:hypothetical protein
MVLPTIIRMARGGATTRYDQGDVAELRRERLAEGLLGVGRGLTVELASIASMALATRSLFSAVGLEIQPRCPCRASASVEIGVKQQEVGVGDRLALDDADTVSPRYARRCAVLETGIDAIPAPLLCQRFADHAAAVRMSLQLLGCDSSSLR